MQIWGDRGSTVVKVLCYKFEGRWFDRSPLVRSIPAGVSGFFIDINFFPSPCGPAVDSASNKNEYQQYFLEVKSGRCVRLPTLPPSCAVVTKSVNLNFLEPSGPVQACNGTALPLHVNIYTQIHTYRHKYIYIYTYLHKTTVLQDVLEHAVKNNKKIYIHTYIYVYIYTHIHT